MEVTGWYVSTSTPHFSQTNVTFLVPAGRPSDLCPVFRFRRRSGLMGSFSGALATAG